MGDRLLNNYIACDIPCFLQEAEAMWGSTFHFVVLHELNNKGLYECSCRKVL
ncbi:hypothetical protein LINPERPRIM_LOCUS20706 [Linum perenne]